MVSHTYMLLLYLSPPPASLLRLHDLVVRTWAEWQECQRRQAATNRPLSRGANYHRSSCGDRRRGGVGQGRRQNYGAF